MKKVSALSFFSGAMGLDLGMGLGGIVPSLVCEFNKDCASTIKKNKPNVNLVGDITKLTPSSVLKTANLDKVDIIFGGPPCQAFSTIGKRKGFSDERGNVFLRYLDFVKEIRPKYVVIENVRGLLSAKYPCDGLNEAISGGALFEIIRRLESSGYAVSFNLYNTANFGVPQIRERLVIIGKLGDQKVPYLSPTHSEHGEFGLPCWRTLGEAISSAGISTCHHMSFSQKKIRFYKLLKQGQYWKDLPENLQKEALGNSYYLGGGKTGFLRRLSFSRPSPTLMTSPAMQATALCHPTKNRPLSIEEYKAIQEFPQDWEVCGSLQEQYRQVGNAVPVRFGEAIAKTILADMRGEVLPQYDGFRYSRYKNTDEVSWMAGMECRIASIKSQN